MRRALRSAVVAGLSALGLLAAATPPAQAATGFDRCPAGRFCLFDKHDGTGTMVTYGGGNMATLGAYDNWASAVRNRTGLHACIFSEPYHRLDGPDDVLLIMGNGDFEHAGDISYVKSDDGRTSLDDNVSSFRLTRTAHECETGDEFPAWTSDGTGTAAPRPFGDFNADGVQDLLVRSLSGSLWYLKGDRSGQKLGSGWNAMNVLQRHGDRDGDGAEDLVTRDGNGLLWMYPGDSAGGIKPRVQIGIGWSTLRNITAMGDFNGDGRRGDVVTNDSSGRLWLFAGRANGTLEPRKQIGTSGWQGMTALVGAGDMNGDRRNDLVARDRTGRLWLYPGKGNGTLGARQQIGSGWQNLRRVISLGPMDGEGVSDLVAFGNGILHIYTNNGMGRLTLTGFAGGWDDREAAF